MRIRKEVKKGTLRIFKFESGVLKCRFKVDNYHRYFREVSKYFSTEIVNIVEKKELEQMSKDAYFHKKIIYLIFK